MKGWRCRLSGEPGSPEGGSATLWMLGVCAVLLVAASSVGVLGAVVLARQRAAGVADLAALAGAQDALAGGDGCATAARLVVVSGGQLVACSSATGEVELEVSLSLPRPLTALGAARVRARAGPPPAP